MIDLSVLNPRQREAVEHADGPLLVSAGAGSGKTRVITYRIAHLICDLGVDPASILAVTFTNKAANEMRERVFKLLDAVHQGLTVSTFHSFCARFLRRHSAAAGLDPSFTILDVSAQEKVLKELLEKSSPKPAGTPRRWLSSISRLKEQGYTPERARTEAGSRDERLAADLYIGYQGILRSQNAVDFDDLLLESVLVLQKHPDILDRWRRSLSYILVDEYQDTNFLQFELMRLLAGAAGLGLCVVGDEDQSIYGWRGASIDHIRRFEHDYPKARVVLLEDNYRSTAPILAAASRLISRNANRYPKTLRTTRGEGAPIIRYDAEGPEDEVLWLTNELRQVIREGDTPAAVLYRANHMSRAVEDGLVRAGLKYRIVGSLRFYERREIKDLSSYLRLLVNPRDVQAFTRALHVPPRRGLGPKTITALVESARLSSVDCVSVARRAASGAGAAAAGLRDFIRVMDSLGKAEGGIGALVRAIVASTSYEQRLKETEPPDEAEDRIGNVQEFIQAAEEFDRERRGSLLDFLDTISLTTAQDEVPSSAPILLMTIHSAKGLEFPSVFIVNMNENAFPLAHTLYRPEELEEERRLCYVGMTRAMRRLSLSCSAVPSRFLREAEESGAVILRGRSVDVRSPYRRMPTTSTSAIPKPRSSLPQYPFHPSERVTHPAFGEGTVLRLSGEGDTAIATVSFDHHGVKRLVLSFANLTRATSS